MPMRPVFSLNRISARDVWAIAVSCHVSQEGEDNMLVPYRHLLQSDLQQQRHYSDILSQYLLGLVSEILTVASLHHLPHHSSSASSSSVSSLAASWTHPDRSRTSPR